MSVSLKHVALGVMPAAVKKIGASWIACGDHVINCIAITYEKSKASEIVIISIKTCCNAVNDMIITTDPRCTYFFSIIYEFMRHNIVLVRRNPSKCWSNVSLRPSLP